MQSHQIGTWSAVLLQYRLPIGHRIANYALRAGAPSSRSQSQPHASSFLHMCSVSAHGSALYRISTIGGASYFSGRVELWASLGLGNSFFWTFMPCVHARATSSNQGAHHASPGSGSRAAALGPLGPYDSTFKDSTYSRRDSRTVSVRYRLSSEFERIKRSLIPVYRLP